MKAVHNPRKTQQTRLVVCDWTPASNEINHLRAGSVGIKLLDEARLRQEGYFHPAPIRKKWEENLVGSRNWQYRL